jgi:hypothetical protein
MLIILISSKECKCFAQKMFSLDNGTFGSAPQLLKCHQGMDVRANGPYHTPPVSMALLKRQQPSNDTGTIHSGVNLRP